jgi:hypothetical protein
MRELLKAACVTAIALLVALPASADVWNKKTFLTFSGPVQVPGATLPAGTYTFKLADLSGNRHVVQIFDKAEKKIFTTILAIPDQRLEPSDKPVVMFAERAAGTPQAVKAWFYPGETIGNEFVYPKSQAIAIAKATHETVLATNETSTETERMKSAEVGRVNESGEMTTAAPATTTASGATTTASSAAVGTAGGNNARATRSELPRTAGELPLFGLLSGLLLSAGVVLRRLR